MFKMYFWVRSLLNKKDGQSMVEYGLIIALIAVVVIAVLALLGGKIANMFKNVANSF
jgi:pilus assembly protein Flp/PilA